MNLVNVLKKVKHSSRLQISKELSLSIRTVKLLKMLSWKSNTSKNKFKSFRLNWLQEQLS